MSQLKIKDGNNWIDIPASGIGVPSGGTTGQVLQKSSNTDYATEWATLPNVVAWKNSGLSTTGTGSLDISGLTFNELCVITKYTDNPAVFIIPEFLLSSTTIYLRVGCGGSSGEQALYILTATRSSIALYKVTIGGTTYTNSTVVSVYYR